MADDLHRLGLYATANAVRSGREPLTEGVRHVRDYCLPSMITALADRERKDAEDPPIPGTWGETAAAGIRRRRDDLQAFLDDWFAYDLPYERAA